MYRVLIADDELRDRNIIKILLERRYAGQFQFLEAENGQQALEILNREQVQLLILDINMPGLSGIDVLHGIKGMPYVIVLTAYDNFEYTREALRCGVRDYLLKPPLREEFYRAVDHFLEDCERVQENLAPQIQSREVFTRDLARQLMYFGDAKKIRGLLDVLDITGQYALCGLLRVDLETDQGCVLDEAEELLDRWGTPYAAAAYGGDLAVFLFCGDEDASEPLRLLTRLAQSLENDLCAPVRAQTGPLAAVFGSYPKTFLELTRFEKDGQMAFQAEVQQTDLEDAVRHRDFAAAMEALRPILEAMEKSGEYEDLLKYQLLLALSQCTSQILGGKAANEAYHRISGLISARGREQATEITARYLEWLLQETRGTDGLRNNVVQVVLEKVQEDCSQPWSIDSLADSLHVNACYLSHLFKEHTGRCFTDYLAEQRITRAVELMKTMDMSLARIGEQVGYGDPNYFSRVFKKRRGVGPREFSRTLKATQQK